MSNENVIVIITEGTTQTTKINEVSLIETCFNPLYLSNTNIKIVSYGTHIYNLFHKLNNNEFLDTYTILKNLVTDKDNKNLEYEVGEVSEIYLFFDLDAHSNEKHLIPENFDIISQMLELFNDPFDKGLLYISYPMFEAYKHPISDSSVTKIDVGKQYKTLTAQSCDKKLEQLKKMSKHDWDLSLISHLININDFVSDKNAMPQKYSEEYFAQDIIYQKQLEEHIKPNQEVRVISPFCLFLLDFLGSSLLDEWKVIDE